MSLFFIDSFLCDIEVFFFVVFMPLEAVPFLADISELLELVVVMVSFFCAQALRKARPIIAVTRGRIYFFIGDLDEARLSDRRPPNKRIHHPIGRKVCSIIPKKNAQKSAQMRF